MVIKEEIFAQVDPKNIDLLRQLIENYDNLGIVSTLDQYKGEVIIRVTPDTYGEVKDILQNLPFAVRLV